jgi:TolB-like protein
VRVYRVRDVGAANAPLAPTQSELPLPDKPSVAVLPFTNMSGDPEQEFFSDGIAEDIITALSRYSSLFVIARNSCFTYKGRAVDVKQVGRELGVRYVLEGGVRKAGNRIRVTAQLVEAEGGRQVWAERYDRNLADIFALQDEITEGVTIALVLPLPMPSSTGPCASHRRASTLGPPIRGRAKPARPPRSRPPILRWVASNGPHRRILDHETARSRRKQLARRAGPRLIHFPGSHRSAVIVAHGSRPNIRVTTLRPELVGLSPDKILASPTRRSRRAAPGRHPCNANSAAIRTRRPQ